MRKPFKHQVIKQVISLAVIWLAFQVTALSAFLSRVPWLTGLKDLLTVSLFMSLYKVIDSIYDKWLWRLFHWKHVISGQWVYALHSLHSGRSVFGTFTIDQSIDSIEILDGMCWYAPGEMRGSWQGQVVDWSGNTITILFRMRSLNVTRPGSPIGEVNEGVFIASYTNTPIVKLRGVFNDLGIRSQSRGTFSMRKIGKLSQEEIDQIGMELIQEIKPTQTEN